MIQRITIVLHFLLVLMSFTAWIWLDYRLLIVLAVAHLIMLEALKGCPLSQVQFLDDKDKRFYEWWMEKLGVRFTKTSRRQMRIFMQYIMPVVIIGLSVVLQVMIGVTPLINF